MNENGSRYLQDLPRQLLYMVFTLAAVLGVHYSGLLRLDATLFWTIIAVVVGSAFVPAAYRELASSIGFLVIGGVSYFHFGSKLMGVLGAVFGIWSLVSFVRSLRTARRHGSDTNM